MSSVSIIRSVYDAFARGDISALMQHFHPQIEWREAEGFTYADGNPYIGPDRVLHGVFARIGADFEGWKVVPQEHIDAGAIVVTLGRYQGRIRRTGKQVDAPFAHIWRFEGDRIRAFQQLTDTSQFTDVGRRG